jgi:sterol desaturase/sphingolipid hydroxylase (fatty acid hydroxylase superfamily)
MLCVSCLRERTAVKEKKTRDWFLPSVLVQFGVGLLILWVTAFLLARMLAALPESFHEGAVWEPLIGG